LSVKTRKKKLKNTNVNERQNPHAWDNLMKKKKQISSGREGGRQRKNVRKCKHHRSVGVQPLETEREGGKVPKRGFKPVRNKENWDGGKVYLYDAR